MLFNKNIKNLLDICVICVPENNAIDKEACFYDTGSAYSGPQHIYLCGPILLRTYPVYIVKVTANIQAPPLH